MKNLAIRENHLYKKVYDGGKKAIGKYVIIYILRDLKAWKYKKAHPLKVYVNRIGLTATKKIGKAVIRNRVKRILRVGYREIEKNYQIKKGLLVVIVARSTAIDAKSTEIYNEMQKLFKELQIIEPL